MCKWCIVHHCWSRFQSLTVERRQVCYDATETAAMSWEHNTEEELSTASTVYPPPSPPRPPLPPLHMGMSLVHSNVATIKLLSVLPSIASFKGFFILHRLLIKFFGDFCSSKIIFLWWFMTKDSKKKFDFLSFVVLHFKSEKHKSNKKIDI